MRYLKLKLEYDGSAFCGWQKQPRGERTVQGELEQSLAKLIGTEVTVCGAGRTDTGVHAMGQVAHLATTMGIPVERFPAALNSYLPSDIVVRDAAEVDASFHARYSAWGKDYCYLILNRRKPTAIWRHYCYHVPYSLDERLLRDGAQRLTGKHDFRAFSATGSSIRTTVRTLTNFQVERHGDWLALMVSGDAFLYRMVRLMAGILLEVGRGKLPPERIDELLVSGERGHGGPALPPQGLYLMKIYYPGDQVDELHFSLPAL